MRQKRIDNNRGLTLIEVTVTTVIATATLLAMAAGGASISRLTTQTGADLTLPLVAFEKMGMVGDLTQEISLTSEMAKIRVDAVPVGGITFGSLNNAGAGTPDDLTDDTWVAFRWFPGDNSLRYRVKQNNPGDITIISDVQGTDPEVVAGLYVASANFEMQDAGGIGTSNVFRIVLTAGRDTNHTTRLETFILTSAEA